MVKKLTLHRRKHLFCYSCFVKEKIISFRGKSLVLNYNTNLNCRCYVQFKYHKNKIVNILKIIPVNLA